MFGLLRRAGSTVRFGQWRREWPTVALLVTGGSATAALAGNAQTSRVFSQSAAAGTLAVASNLQAPLLQVKEPVKLYQYDVCPFCNKVQAFLEFHKIPFQKVEVNPLTKAEIKFQEYRMVPFAIIDGKQVNGSGLIIETLLGENRKSDEEEKWCQWVDDHLVHVLPPNIYRTPGEALASFDYISNSSNFTFFQRQSAKYAGALVMYFIAKRAKKKYNLSDNARQDLFDSIEHWVVNGLGEKEFHSGSSSPDTADLAVFGVLRSIDHSNYETWTDLENHDFPNKKKFWSWYNAIKTCIRE